MIVESYEDVIVLSGSLRSNFWETIHTAVSLTLKRHPTGVVIDCSGITEITTEGADTFVDAIRFVEDHDQARIVVAAVPPHVKEVLRQVPDVRSQLPEASTVEEARRSLDLLVEEEDLGKKKRKEPTKAFDRIIVGVVSSDEGDTQMLHVVEEMVENLPAKVVLVAPIVVPRDKPVSAPMPVEEEKAAASLDAGRNQLMNRGIPCDIRLERHRELSTLIQEVGEELNAAHIVVGLASDLKGDESYIKVLRSVIERVKRPLVIVRGARV
ncbi:MAG: universal stress protein [Fimbriimonadaceae bacterium]|nr:universal stress protein [Fimbriimonadaceae bacterium]QYK58387.1 MAG: universal stress protein [Fimbriimonadaceae bacterium]